MYTTVETERVKHVRRLATKIASDMGCDYIGTEHLLLGILMEGGGTAARILEKFKVTELKVKKVIEDMK